MNYELAKELKDAGFPQDHLGEDGRSDFVEDDLSTPESEWVHFVDPTLEELIEACGKRVVLYQAPDKGKNDWITDSVWVAGILGEEDYMCGNENFIDDSIHYGVIGATPIEAVARLWLALNAKETPPPLGINVGEVVKNIDKPHKL